MSGPAFAALDAGGTVLKGVVVDGAGRILNRLRRPTRRERGPDAVVAGILDLLEELTITAAPNAVGLVVPGVVAGGTALYSANLGWRDLPLRRLAEERLGLPVALGHDVRAGALAEGAFGAARGCDDYLFVALGTGIGAALVLGGRPYPGTVGKGGEVGHLVVRPWGEPCSCGNRGCLETVASAAALARRYGADPPISAKDVVDRASAGDAKARSILDGAVEALADGLMSCVTLLDPRLVVIGGGLAGAGDALFGPLRSALDAQLTFQSRPEIIPAALGDDAGCLGAALLASRHLDHALTGRSDDP
jgi:glucokinase